MSEIPWPVFLDSNVPIFSRGWGEGVSQPLLCLQPFMFSCHARSELNHTSLMGTHHYIFLFTIIHEFGMLHLICFSHKNE